MSEPVRKSSLGVWGCRRTGDYAGTRRSSRNPEVTARICEIGFEPGGVKLSRVWTPGVWRSFSYPERCVKIRRSSGNPEVFLDPEITFGTRRTMDKAGICTDLQGAVPGTGPRVLRSGEPGCLLAGTQRPVSCLGSRGIQYLSIFRQQFAPYCSIFSSNSGNKLCTQVTGVVYSQQASLRPGSGAIEPLTSCRRWTSSGFVMASWRLQSLEL
ncbi:hypothetical protein F2Q69_00012582 [Brassica cretica]|uniref:Uncharacterized protein n=1 Tax=Brassica cretica TaxID=69181 RepID=A0A8S9QYI5_BRACR|nr:hypothetical protein F2Q69_00012582 [Brassica cretica]